MASALFTIGLNRLTFSDGFRAAATRDLSHRAPVRDDGRAGRASSASTLRGPVMESNAPAAPEMHLQVRTFDGPLGRRIIETHIWAVREGLRGAAAYDLF